jgi:hypothetical protein
MRQELTPDDLIEAVLQLRAAEAEAPHPSLHAVRARLEEAIGPTVRKSVAARVLGVTAPALVRWVRSGDLPLVLTPAGRREVPLSLLLDICDASRRAPGSAVRRLKYAFSEARKAAAEHLSEADHAGADMGLAYHRAVAARLDARHVSDAQTRLDRWVASGAVPERTEAAWRELLRAPLDDIAAAITAADDRGHFLRQSSPFAGALTGQERQLLLRGSRGRGAA